MNIESKRLVDIAIEIDAIATYTLNDVDMLQKLKILSNRVYMIAEEIELEIKEKAKMFDEMNNAGK